jgi:hypothetical protein
MDRLCVSNFLYFINVTSLRFISIQEKCDISIQFPSKVVSVRDLPSPGWVLTCNLISSEYR